MADLTIVLPTFDRRRVLERTIGQFLLLARQHPLLVIDDGSRDGTAEWLRHQGLRVLRLPRHEGLPRARNRGLQVAQTRWVLFAEDDVLMPLEHPGALLAASQRLPQAGAVAGLLFSGTAWTLPTTRPGPRPGPLLDRELLLGNFASAISGSVALPTVHACALVDRAEALAVGGYDPRYDGSSFREESDLYARMWAHGRSCHLVPEAWSIHVRHRLGGGCRGAPSILDKALLRLSHYRNNARYVDRHIGLWRHWGVTAGPGAVKAAYGQRLLSTAWAAWRGAEP